MTHVIHAPVVPLNKCRPRGMKTCPHKELYVEVQGSIADIIRTPQVQPHE